MDKCAAIISEPQDQARRERGTIAVLQQFFSAVSVSGEERTSSPQAWRAS